MQQKEKICSHCHNIFVGKICENCSVRCSICNKIIASYSVNSYYIGCKHVIGKILGENEEIIWENPDYEKRFRIFRDEHSIDYNFGDDMNSEMEIYDVLHDALEEYAKNEGLELLKHEDPINSGMVCYFMIGDN